MKMRNLFRPLRVPAVWLVVLTVATVAFTAWWFGVIEPTVNYRLAWRESWQFWLASGSLLLLFSLTPETDESNYMRIHVFQYCLAMALFTLMLGTFIFWGANVLPVMDAFNVSKALASLGFLMASFLLVGLTLHRVYQDNKHRLAFPESGS